MSTDVVLRGDVGVEPLVRGWYAWLHALSPLTSVLLARSVQLPVMRSYVSAPSVHASAVADPAFRGGPFVDLTGDRSQEVSELIAETERTRQPALDAVEDLFALEASLCSDAGGTSLGEYYDGLPQSLRGLVELTYDRMQRPSVQVLEALLYRSELYRREDQQVDLFVSQNDRRPFVLSTPRLPAPNRCRLDVRFSDPRLDDLFGARSRPASMERMREQFADVLATSEGTFDALFQPVSPSSVTADGSGTEGLRLRYYGHACVLVESGGFSILVDPMLPARTSDDGRFGWENLPERIDLCLITHGHPDHFVFEALLQLRHRIDTIAVPRSSAGAIEDPSLKLALGELGFSSVVALDEFESLPVPGGEVHSVPFLGEHADLRIRSKCCYFVRIGDRKILFAADAAPENPELVDRVIAELGPVDDLFLGMECDGAPLTWLYGHLFARPVDRNVSTSRRLSGSDARLAWEWACRSKAAQVYVYAMGFEPWAQHIMATNVTPDSKQSVEIETFLHRCREHGIEAEVLSISRELLLAHG